MRRIHTVYGKTSQRLEFWQTDDHDDNDQWWKASTRVSTEKVCQDDENHDSDTIKIKKEQHEEKTEKKYKIINVNDSDAWITTNLCMWHAWKSYAPLGNYLQCGITSEIINARTKLFSFVYVIIMQWSYQAQKPPHVG